MRETHVFSPRVLNTATVGFSRAAFNLDPVSLASFPASTSFVVGRGPGGIVVERRSDHNGPLRHHGRGSEQRRGFVESQKSVHLYG